MNKKEYDKKNIYKMQHTSLPQKVIFAAVRGE